MLMTSAIAGFSVGYAMDSAYDYNNSQNLPNILISFAISTVTDLSCPVVIDISVTFKPFIDIFGRLKL